jgi:hypothetical protein
LTNVKKNSYIIDHDFFTVPWIDEAWNDLPSVSVARIFLRWGGFHKLEPIDASGDILEKDWFMKPDREQVRMRAALQLCSRITRLTNPAVKGEPTVASAAATASASMNSSKSRSTTKLDNSRQLASQPVRSPSMASPKSSSPTTLDIPISHESTSKATRSPPMASPKSSSPTTLDTPISHKSTSKATQSHSLLQPISHSPPELTQLPPEPTPKVTIPPSVKITNEPKKEALRKQMSRAKQLQSTVKNKQPATKTAQNLKATKKLEIKEERREKERLEKETLDKLPEEGQSKNIISNFWKFLGR